MFCMSFVSTALILVSLLYSKMFSSVSQNVPLLYLLYEFCINRFDCPWAYCVGTSLNSLFVCLLSVRPSVRLSSRSVLSRNPPKLHGGVSVRVKNQSVWDIPPKALGDVSVRMSHQSRLRSNQSKLRDVAALCVT